MDEKIDYEKKIERVETFEEAKVFLKNLGEDGIKEYNQEKKEGAFYLKIFASLGISATVLAAASGIPAEDIIRAIEVVVVPFSLPIAANLYKLIHGTKGSKFAQTYLDFSHFDGMTEEEIIEFTNNEIDKYDAKLEEHNKSKGNG